MRHENKLIAYSSLAICFIGNSRAMYSQVVYTDIDPDIMLLEDEDVAGIDMDNNGTFDFAFLNESDIGYAYPSGNILGQQLWCGAYGTPANAIAGTSFSWEGYYYYFPYALSYGFLINEALSFQNGGYQRMAFRTYFLDWGSKIDGGDWFPELIDHYLGVRFIDDASDHHYGWIRCSVLDSGRTLIIHDYAYESMIDHPIEAGDTVHYIEIHIGTEDMLTVLKAEVYGFENRICIRFQEQPSQTLLQICDMAGNEIYRTWLTEKETLLPFDHTAGLYAVAITSEKSRFTAKVAMAR
ncbi:MAG: hypothetical protein H7X71_02560 [Chitinophagales bacterium]|nr:hypothetical protein [Chitinophagales bacterium]